MPCKFNTIKVEGVNGMFHCPECGEMVIAGAPHPDYSLLEKDDMFMTDAQLLAEERKIVFKQAEQIKKLKRRLTEVEEALEKVLGIVRGMKIG
jgi:hypothetical protein